MKYRIVDNVAVVTGLAERIADAESKYESGVTAMAFSKDCFIEDFFRLSSGIAGEVIQKFVNYGIRAAVFGDFSQYTSKPLRDFIYESNKGCHFGFLDSENDAVEWLNR